MKRVIVIYALIKRLLTYIFYGSSIDKLLFWRKVNSYVIIIGTCQFIIYLFYRSYIIQNYRGLAMILLISLMVIMFVSQFMSWVMKRRMHNKIKKPLV